MRIKKISTKILAGIVVVSSTLMPIYAEEEYTGITENDEEQIERQDEKQNGESDSTLLEDKQENADSTIVDESPIPSTSPAVEEQQDTGVVTISTPRNVTLKFYQTITTVPYGNYDEVDYGYEVNGVTPTDVFTATNTYEGDTFGGAHIRQDTEPTEPGTYTQTVSITSNDIQATPISRKFTLERQDVTITMDEEEYEYNGSAQGAVSIQCADKSHTLAPTLISTMYKGVEETEYNSSNPPTEEGKYEVTAAYAGDGIHKNKSRKFTFKITESHKRTVTLKFHQTIIVAPYGTYGEVNYGYEVNGTTPTDVFTAINTYEGDTFAGVHVSQSTEPKEPGTYTQTVSIKSTNIQATPISRKFTLERQNIAITIDKNEYVHNGSAQGVVSVECVDKSHILDPTLISTMYKGVEETEYNSSNPPTKAGKYEVTTTYAGDGIHKNDSKTFTFKIIEPIKKTVTLKFYQTITIVPYGTYDDPDYGYEVNGTTPTDVFTAINIYEGDTFGGVHIKQSAEPTEPGTYTQSVSLTSNDIQATPISRKFTLERQNIAIIMDKTEYVFNGSAQGVVSVECVDKSHILDPTLVSTMYKGVEETEYNSSNPPTKAGKYEVTTTYAGDGIHKNDSKTFTFKIIEPIKKTVTLKFYQTITTVSYGTYDDPDYGYEVNGTTPTDVFTAINTYEGDTFAGVHVSQSTEPTEPGTYTQSVSLTSDDIQATPISRKFTLERQDVIGKLNLLEYEFNGKPQGIPTITCVDDTHGLQSNGITLRYTGIKGTTYDSATAPSGEGNYSVTIEYTGDSIHKDGQYAFEYVIKPIKTNEKIDTTNWDNGGPFTFDQAGNEYDHWGNMIYKNENHASNYKVPNTADK